MPTGIGGEVGWWCPSLDDVGNGTSTLYDLAGSKNITLTNMEEGDWVADTTNGGIRSLQFDGVNEYGDGGTSITFSPSPMSISFWCKSNSNPTIFEGMIGKVTNGSWNSGWGVFFESATNIRFWMGIYSVSYANATVASATSWNHYACIWNPSTQLKIHVNTVSGTTTGTVPATQTGTTTQLAIGRHQSDPYNLACRMDDIRIFNRVITSDEITALASQRGYQPSTGKKRPRINGSLVNAGLCRSRG